MKRYINIKTVSGVETVDEFPFNNRNERLEAKRCLKEYSISCNYYTYYLSQRCDNSWKS
jgi:hypothetical protein